MEALTYLTGEGGTDKPSAFGKFTVQVNAARWSLDLGGKNKHKTVVSQTNTSAGETSKCFTDCVYGNTNCHSSARK